METDLIPIAPLVVDFARDPAYSSLDSFKARNPAEVYLRHLGSEKSRRVMRHALNLIAHRFLNVPQHRLILQDSLTRSKREDMTYLFCAWERLRYEHTAKVRSQLAALTAGTAEHPDPVYAPATVNRMLAALRGTLKEAWRLDLLTTDRYHRAADIQDISYVGLPRGRALTHGEITTLIQTCYHDAAFYAEKPAQRATDYRDGAIIAVLYSIGARRQEVVALDLADYTPDTGAITIHHGKGNKARIAYLASGAIAALNDWLIIRGTDAGPLFCSMRRGDTIPPEQKLTGKRLSDQAILYLLKGHQQRTKMPAFSPHDLRRTTVGDMLENGVDITTVKNIVGHANVETTAKYDRRGERAKKAAADKLHVPYSPRTASE